MLKFYTEKMELHLKEYTKAREEGRAREATSHYFEYNNYKMIIEGLTNADSKINN